MLAFDLLQFLNHFDFFFYFNFMFHINKWKYITIGIRREKEKKVEERANWAIKWITYICYLSHTANHQKCTKMKALNKSQHKQMKAK